MHEKTVLKWLILWFVLFGMFSMTTDCVTEGFIPYNAFVLPSRDPVNDGERARVYNVFETLVSTVNSTEYETPYDLGHIDKALLNVLNATGMGMFEIVRVGRTDGFSLENVTVRNVNTFETATFGTVDFTVDTLNPYVVKKVKMSVDDDGNVNPDIVPVDHAVDDSLFRIQNKYHLFSPYKTSDDEMKMTQDTLDAATDLSKSLPVVTDTNFRSMIKSFEHHSVDGAAE